MMVLVLMMEDRTLFLGNDLMMVRNSLPTLVSTLREKGGLNKVTLRLLFLMWL